jgi:hypothetical protein
MKSFSQFLNEDFFPGTVEVPGDAYITQVNSRNYKAAHQPLPEVYDAMFEGAYFCDFLDECGKSENFSKFVGKGKKSPSDITGYLKEEFMQKSKDKKK